MDHEKGFSILLHFHAYSCCWVESDPVSQLYWPILGADFQSVVFGVQVVGSESDYFCVGVGNLVGFWDDDTVSAVLVDRTDEDFVTYWLEHIRLSTPPSPDAPRSIVLRILTERRSLFQALHVDHRRFPR